MLHWFSLANARKQLAMPLFSLVTLARAGYNYVRNRRFKPMRVSISSDPSSATNWLVRPPPPAAVRQCDLHIHRDPFIAEISITLRKRRAVSLLSKGSEREPSFVFVQWEGKRQGRQDRGFSSLPSYIMQLELLAGGNAMMISKHASYTCYSAIFVAPICSRFSMAASASYSTDNKLFPA